MRVPTAWWAPLANAATLETFDRARGGMLTLQCLKCGSPHSLVADCQRFHPNETGDKPLVLFSFEAGRTDVESTVTSLLGLLDTARDINSGCQGGAHCRCYELWTALFEFLAMVGDPERQFSLQLALLRRFPSVPVICSRQSSGSPQEHPARTSTKQLQCYLCKQAGHCGSPCEAAEPKAPAGPTMKCPACGSPALKTLGCASMCAS
eukprot:SAG31_NODE_635_length_13360_cov_4.229847_14_plen_207_part_00